jgi:diguanylate cyclase (GGDEF)-like protein
MRRFALLAVSVIAVMVLGTLAVWAQWDSGHTVDRARQSDRLTLQTTLAGLTDQYLQFTFLSTKTAADTTAWQLKPNDERDRVALQALVKTSPLTRFGAAVVSLTGRPLTGYPRASTLPPVTDPGYAPMRRALLAGKPGLSDVMEVAGAPVVAFAVPITSGGVPVGLLVAYADVRTWPLQGYDAKLHVGARAQSYVVDASGTIAAASDPAQIGRKLPALRHVKTSGTTGFVGYHDGRGSWVMSFGHAGANWQAVTVQPASTFSGVLDRGRELQSLALAMLLSITVLSLAVFHHKRQVTLARLAEERLYDPLTGLGQRGVFEMRVRAALARRSRNHHPIAVMFCDVDDFKEVNDRHGHNAGDQLLATIGRRISEAVRDTDMVARLGGDEFGVVMEETSDAEAAQVADRIRRHVGAPFAINGRDMTPRISVGVAVLAEGDAALNDLLHEADMAMYQAKRANSGDELLKAAADASPATNP